jgi:serine/threonine-protein kinase
MEFIEGRDFREVLNDTGALPLSSALQVAGSCAFALDYAHERSVLHLDLKPDNLMLTSDSILKIIDFGTARRIGKKLSGDDGYIEGSPPYMSPEQIRGHPLDHRTDVYSLGAIIYELLEGRPPFAFNSDLKTIVETLPPPIANVSPDAADVVLKAMAKDREDRWSTAGEFYRELLRSADADGVASA